MVFKKKFLINNIYAKTVYKKGSTSHELHSITSVKGLIERWKLPQQGPGRSPGSFSFNCIFIDKKGAFWSFIDLN